MKIVILTGSYNLHGTSNTFSLYKLGTIESRVDIFGNIDEDFEVTIERVN